MTSYINFALLGVSCDAKHIWLIAHSLKDYWENVRGALTPSELSNLKKRKKVQSKTYHSLKEIDKSTAEKVIYKRWGVEFPWLATSSFLDSGKAFQRVGIPSGAVSELAARLPRLDKSLTNSCLEDPGKRPHFPSKGSQDHFKVLSKSQLLLIRPLFC